MNEKQLIKFFKKTRKDFPILKKKVNKKNLVYVDNGASTQKPKVMINSIVDYYENYNSNVHRGIHTLSEKATDRYEEVREETAKFINANKDEIVFTKGTTDSLNLTIFGLKHLLKKGDEILLTKMEHHANLVPWQEIARETGATLKFISYDKDFHLDIDEAKKLITNKTKLLGITHTSNLLGAVNPIKELSKLAHKVGALIVVDAAQSAPHMKIDVKDLNCDFLAFSAHKMCGPTGLGILYGKKEHLEKLNPILFGGDMIEEVSLEKSSLNKVPYRLEAGTPNIAGVIGFGAAIEYMNSIGFDNIEAYEKQLLDYATENLKKI